MQVEGVGTCVFSFHSSVWVPETYNPEFLESAPALNLSLSVHVCTFVDIISLSLGMLLRGE